MRKSVAALGLFAFAAAFSPVAVSSQGATQLVRVTPLGSHAGELCFRDRAMVFEDPTGIRILYDPGFTVDEADPRLGDIHVMLLSHVHGDHLGTDRPLRGGGTCAVPVTAAANPNSNFATIAATKRAAVIVHTDTVAFLGAKIRDAVGSATPGCPTSGPENETVVPVPTACTAGLNHGAGSRLITRSGAGSVRIAVVPALHGNGIPAPYLASTPPPGVIWEAGPAVGYVITFSNGLRAYLSGDTGPTIEMDMIGKMYRPSLAVININDVNTMGPTEAAFAVQQFIRPQTVLVTHVNEGATSGGVEIAGTRTDRFARQVRGVADVVIAVSDVTRSFDGEGRCVGCR